jgi:alpha-mannosidase
LKENKGGMIMSEKKRVHLICNAHIDPIWMWDWEEGASVALSTFYAAAELSEEFEYIFCHNEALLYEYIEKYDPVLFDRIRRLIAEGKWKIIGGWYLQPDANLPSGESFVRQIMHGRRYFEEKFSQSPKTALNFDSFGHSRGLVQILKKTGYDSYLCCRPMPEFIELEDYVMEWEGYDGSKVKLRRSDHMYCSSRGETVNGIKTLLEKNKSEKKHLILWGVGNHGGGPSRKDLQEIAEWTKETDEYEVIHDTPEGFFKSEIPSKTFSHSLQHWAPGCYSSLSSVKQRHIELENELLYTEKMASMAALQYGMKYPEQELIDATKNLLFIEFHDILPGTCTMEGERTALYRAEGSIAALSKLKAGAFFAMTENYKKMADGIYPIAVYNPHSYPIKTVVESEFLIENAYAAETFFRNIYVLDENNRYVRSQVVEESSNINYDRRKRVLFEAELPAMGTALYGFELRLDPKIDLPQFIDGFTVEGIGYSATFDGKTGLLSSLIMDGKERLSAPIQLFVYDDSPDPWGLQETQTGKMGINPRSVALDDCKEGVFRGLDSIAITEDGALCTKVESLFRFETSFFRIAYLFYKTEKRIDIEINTYWNERERMLKLHVPTVDSETLQVLGQVPFGTEVLPKTGQEMPVHRFVAAKEQDCFAIFNKSIYGTSFEDGVFCFSLLRGAAYCAHIMDNRPTLFKRNYIPYAEQGSHTFFFRMTTCKEIELEKEAYEFINKPYSLNIFPHGNGETKGAGVCLTNQNVTLVAFKKVDGKEEYIARLCNNSSKNADTILFGFEEQIGLEFGKYEVKTVLFKDGKWLEIDEMII